MKCLVKNSASPYNKIMNKADITKIRDDILLKALEDIPFEGWNMEVIKKASDQLGYSQNTDQSVFLSGMQDVMDHFADLADREMLKTLENIDPESLRIRDRVNTALMARYEWLSQHQEAFNQSLKFWLLPTRKAKAVKITWRTADIIWNWARDTSTDYNRYTKRGLLSGIIASSAFIFANDHDENLIKTRKFIDSRIENVMQFEKAVSKLKKTA